MSFPWKSNGERCSPSLDRMAPGRARPSRCSPLSCLPARGPRAWTASTSSAHAGQVRRIIGYVPQMLSADGTLTGRENLLVFARLYDLPLREQPGASRGGTRVHGAPGRGGQARAPVFRRHDQAAGDRPVDASLPLACSSSTSRRWDWTPLRAGLSGTTSRSCGTAPAPRSSLRRTRWKRRTRCATGWPSCTRGGSSPEGTPRELKASIGVADATLEDVFIHYTGSNLESGGTYRETRRTRRSVRRLG